MGASQGYFFFFSFFVLFLLLFWGVFLAPAAQAFFETVSRVMWWSVTGFR